MKPMKTIKFPNDPETYEIVDKQARQSIEDVKQNITITETDPTVPEWAKAETKPTYTASEVGAAPAGYGEGAKQDGEKGYFVAGDAIGWYRIATAQTHRFSALVALWHEYARGGSSDDLWYVSGVNMAQCLRCLGYSASIPAIVDNIRVVNTGGYNMAVDVYCRLNAKNSWSINIINTGIGYFTDTDQSRLRLQTPVFIGADDTLPEGETLLQTMEWVNPPMQLGVEYRTTERIEGKAVYKKNDNGVIKYRLDGETEWKNYATAVGALPNTTDIPDTLADLTEDSTHRTVTDAEKTAWNAKSNFSGSYNDLTNKPVIPTKTSQLTNDSGFKTTDNNTTYTVASGDSNGQIKITPSSGSAYNVPVKGLGSAAYTNSTAYDAAGAASDVQTNLNSHTENKSNPHGVTAAQVGAVPTSRTVNGKALSGNISLSASDVGLKTESWTFTLEDGTTVTKEVYVG